MSYKVSRAAQDDIIGIYVEGIEKFGVRQAEKYHADLEATFERLAHSPLMARLRSEFVPPVRIHPHQAHMIVYTVDNDRDVFIIRVRGGAEDWASDPVG